MVLHAVEHRTAGTRGAGMRKKTSPEMTRKQALAILHKAHDAVGWHLYGPDASEEERILRGQLSDAFRVLDLALHGKEVHYRPLCEHCYLQLCPFDYIQVHIKEQFRTSPCCTP